MKKPIMHAHRRLIQAGQKTVTTVCGVRVPVRDGGPRRSIIITRNEHLFPAEGREYNCVGCIAIIQEGAK